MVQIFLGGEGKTKTPQKGCGGRSRSTCPEEQRRGQPRASSQKASGLSGPGKAEKGKEKGRDYQLMASLLK